MHLNSSQIAAILHQSYPFLMIDRVVDFKKGESLTAIKNITGNEWVFEGQPCQTGVFPETLLIEAAAQAAILSAFAEDCWLCLRMSAKGGSASCGNAKEFLLRRDVHRRAKPLAIRRRITPTSMVKLSFYLSTLYLEKANEKRISPYLTSRGKPGTTGFARGAPFYRLEKL